MSSACESTHCGCAVAAGGEAPATPVAVAAVNGVPLHPPGQRPDDEALRQRACTELLRQAAQRAGLLPQDAAAAVDGVPSASASDAIEALLEQRLQIPDPDEAACRRHHAAHAAAFGGAERVQLRHVLFAVTQGVDVNALRQRAEAMLIELRCADPGGDAFAAAARQWSNCPTGGADGDLGWLAAADCAPEFAREVFGHPEVGVLPRIVHSRHGLHVVEVLARQPGLAVPFEQVRAAVAQALRQQAWITALRQYLRVLAGAAVLEGVDLDAAATPLVQ